MSIRPMGLSPSSAAGAYPSRRGGTSTPAAPLPFFNIRDFGAKGDGVTDDTAAIQAAINAAALVPTILFPAGKYMISAPLVASVKGTVLRGVNRSNFLDPYSAGASSLNLIAFSNCDMIQVAAGANGVCIRDLSLDGNYTFQNVGTSNHVIHLLDGSAGTVTQEPQILDVTIRDAKGSGIYIGNYVDAAHIERVSIYQCGGDGISVYYADAKISDSIIGHATGDGIGVHQWTCKISGCDIFGNHTGVNVYAGGQYALITNNCINGNQQVGVFIGEAGTIVTGNEFHGNSNGANATYSNVQVGAAATVASNVFGVQGGNLTVASNIFITGGVTCYSSGNVFQAQSATTNYGGPTAPVEAISLDKLTSGQETLRRETVTGSGGPASGSLRVTMLTARKAETITQVRVATANAAGATPTLIRFGIYQEDPSTGTLTLIASTANDTTLFAAANTMYSKALSASFAIVPGVRYGVGLLVVTAATVPSFAGNLVAGGLQTDLNGSAPRLTGRLDAQSDLPASLTTAQMNNPSSFVMYAALLP